jgi:hypothetical protein
VTIQLDVSEHPRPFDPARHNALAGGVSPKEIGNGAERSDWNYL